MSRVVVQGKEIYTYFHSEHKMICRGFSLIAKKLYLQLEHEIVSINKSIISSERVLKQKLVLQTINEMKSLVSSKSLSRKKQLVEAIKLYNQHRPSQLQLREQEYIEFTLALARFQAAKIQTYLNPKFYPSAKIKPLKLYDLYEEVTETINNVTRCFVEDVNEPAYDPYAEDKDLLMILTILSKLDESLCNIDVARGAGAIAVATSECLRLVSGYPYFEGYLLALYRQYEFISQYSPRCSNRMNRRYFIFKVFDILKNDIIHGHNDHACEYYFPEDVIDSIISDTRLKNDHPKKSGDRFCRRLLNKHIKKLYRKLCRPNLHPYTISAYGDVLNLLLIIFEKMFDQPCTIKCDGVAVNDRYFINTSYFALRNEKPQLSDSK